MALQESEHGTDGSAAVLSTTANAADGGNEAPSVAVPGNSEAAAEVTAVEQDAVANATEAASEAMANGDAEASCADERPLGWMPSNWVPVEEGDDDDSPAPSPAAAAAEDPPLPAPIGGAAASPSRGLPMLAMSHVDQSAGMFGEPDDDDVEPVAASPLVSLGHTRDEDLEADGHGGDPTSDQGEHDPSGRARDLISRDLLDELSHEPGGWHEGRGCSTPPVGGGFDTPSEPNTPSPREASQQQYYRPNQNHDGLMCIDQWDWKTDAPEFVPGSMKASWAPTDAQVMGQPYAQAGAWAMPPTGSMGRGAGDGPASGSGDNARLSQMKQDYEWQVRTKSNEIRDMQQRMNQLEIETAQARASWEIERRNLVRQIGHYRAVLERYCIPLEESGAPSYNMEDQYFSAFEPSVPSQWPSSASNQAAGTGAGAGGSSSTSVPNGGAAGFSQAASFPSQQVQGGYAPVGNDVGFMAQTQSLYGASAAAAAAAASGADGGGGGPANSSLDSKMRQLNNLLQEGNASTNRRRPSGSPPGETEAREAGAEGAGGSYADGSIASTLRAMFPHATIRTKAARGGEDGEEGEDGDEDDPDSADGALDHGFEDNHPARPSHQAASAASAENWELNEVLARRVDELEGATAGHIDDRAMKVLQNLREKDQLEALSKVEELFETQGGHCRNLSSMLMSVCRKFERPKSRKDRERERTERQDGEKLPNGGRSRDAGNNRRARRLDEDGDAFDSSESDGDAGQKANSGAQSSSWPQDFERKALRAAGQSTTNEARGSPGMQRDGPLPDVGTPGSKRTGQSWADIQSGDEGDGNEDHMPGFGGPERETVEDENDAWTPAVVDKHARRGFDLKRRGGENWDLKIVMSGLDPPLTETGMGRYCKWLRARLTSFREEHGTEPLRRCKGEVDFSHNRMTNQMVWMLLETLAQHEVHCALLKLFANHISQGGVLAICEFIRMNVSAEAMQELHLSHNEIDDESALELLRTLKSQRPRYPPRRPAWYTGEPTLAPVWLRLNHNRIRDPAGILRIAEDEGITICTAWDRQVCGTAKCVRRDCPLVHLYSFTVQDATKFEKGEENGEGRERRRRGHRDRRAQHEGQ